MEFFEENREEIREWFEENGADLIAIIIEIGKEVVGPMSSKKE